jgi:uncharacterized DUF497 family protein
MRVAGFDWDDGNWPKCGKHGVSRKEIEQCCWAGQRLWPIHTPMNRACGPSERRRPGATSFLVVMHREIDGQAKLRPISARYMHQKEVDQYEGQS